MISKQFVFMVMPFADSTANQVYDNIVKPLCSESGYDVIRADEYTTTKVIYDEIVQSIQKASIVIVDISGKNPNVMYELGIAHALRQESTIILTHDKVAESPFDIKHFRIFEYENSIAGAEKLKTKLRDAIKTVKKDSQAVPVNSTRPAHQDIGKEKETLIQKTLKEFKRLSDWQKSFLIQAVNNDKRQWQRYEMPSGLDVIWVPEIDVLIGKRIVKQVSYDAFLVDDDFFDSLQEAYHAKQQSST